MLRLRLDFLFITGIIIFFSIITILSVKTALGSGIDVQTYVVSPGSNLNAQPLAIKKALKIAMQETVAGIVKSKSLDDKKNKKLLEQNIYNSEMKYIYSFKIIDAGSYLNLYYVKLNVSVRRKTLENELNTLGFKTSKPVLTPKKANYHVYYIKFIGNFNYADPNKLQKLMIKHSKHLKNLYVSSFSDNYEEIKVLYYGNILNFIKSVSILVSSYLNAKVYSTEGNTVVIDVK